MGLWQRLFGRIGKRRNERKEELEETRCDWEKVSFSREKVNFHDQEQRDRYITDCLEQIAEVSRDMVLITGEYNLITSYLTDIEEIEALPDEESEILQTIAHKIQSFEQERQVYQGKKNRMSDSDYYQMRKQEEEVEKGLRKLKDTENYQALIKQDLQRLDGEKHAYEYRGQELAGMLDNLKGMAVIFFMALVICIIMLMVLQFGFEMDISIGYIVAITAAAISITVLSMKYMDAERERVRVDTAANKLVRLQNRVKIRYVNNTNLLDYLYMKYNTDSAAKLEKYWKRYLQEREERKQYAEAEAKLEYYHKQIVLQLSAYPVKTPERWVGQVNAFLDKREMVEIRHELIIRRQSLRKQMDYNNEIAKSARKEITDIAVAYPLYAGEIMDMVERYERRFQ